MTQSKSNSGQYKPY